MFIIRLILAPLVVIATTVQFVLTALFIVGRWIFTGRGVDVHYGPIRIR